MDKWKSTFSCKISHRCFLFCRRRRRHSCCVVFIHRSYGVKLCLGIEAVISPRGDIAVIARL